VRLVGPQVQHAVESDINRPRTPIGGGMNLRLRMEFIAGVEEEWRKRTGRAMTARSWSERCRATRTTSSVAAEKAVRAAGLA
jgi:hypothetical protein